MHSYIKASILFCIWLVCFLLNYTSFAPAVLHCMEVLVDIWVVSNLCLLQILLQWTVIPFWGEIPEVELHQRVNILLCYIHQYFHRNSTIFLFLLTMLMRIPFPQNLTKGVCRQTGFSPVSRKSQVHNIMIWYIHTGCQKNV